MSSPDPVAPQAETDAAPGEPRDVRPTDLPAESAPEVQPGELRDELPADLQPDEFVGAYEFPDNSRRRIPGVIYLALAAICLVAYAVGRDSSALVNEGFAWASAILGAAGIFSITSGWRMRVDEREALVAAQQALGFPVGHASAQQVWHGIRSRPTWRVLCYSAEEPPERRGLVLVDAVDGHVLQQLVQDDVDVNPDRVRAVPSPAGDPTPPSPTEDD